MPTVLGVNSAYHESAAALVRDGEVLLAVEEERLNRRKHGKEARVDNPDELPWLAIRACLERGGLDLAEVDAIGYSLQPGRRRPSPGAVDFGTPEGEAEFDRRVRAVLAAFPPGPEFHHLPHHLCHAAHAFHSSPFPDSAVLVVDGIGEDCTAWLGRGEGDALERLEEIPYPHSLGFVWERLCAYLGFSEYDAGKVMALAACGDAGAFRQEFLQMVPDDPRLGFRVDADAAGFRRPDMAGLERLFGPRRRVLVGHGAAEEEPVDSGRFADVAAALQRRTEEVLLRLARRLHALTGSPRLAYSGGVALNCVANAVLAREGPFEALYIPGAAHDAGTALGAAFLLSPRTGRTAPLTPFLGPEWSEAQVLQALQGLDAREVDPAVAAADLLAQGEVVGWFQGALEFGPRALGHRSLLADPRDPALKTRLNGQVKHREAFRPFAASVLAERAAEWFDAHPAAAPSQDLMLFTWPARRPGIPAVLHRDGTCRPQWVHRESDPLYHRLLQQFEQRTGIPMVLNTSFNDQEPIVASPEDAVRTCRHAGIRRLVIHRWQVDL